MHGAFEKLFTSSSGDLRQSWFIRQQKELKLEFGTRLGRYFIGLLWIHILVVSSYFFFPVEIQILNGYQLIWLCVVIVPLLSSSLLFAPKEKHLMKLIPGNEILLARYILIPPSNAFPICGH